MAQHAPVPVPARRLRTLSATAKQLGVSERTVRRYIAAGELRAYRLGSHANCHVRVDQADIEAFLTEVQVSA